MNAEKIGALGRVLICIGCLMMLVPVVVVSFIMLVSLFSGGN